MKRGGCDARTRLAPKTSPATPAKHLPPDAARLEGQDEPGDGPPQDGVCHGPYNITSPFSHTNQASLPRHSQYILSVIFLKVFQRRARRRCEDLVRRLRQCLTRNKQLAEVCGNEGAMIANSNWCTAVDNMQAARLFVPSHAALSRPSPTPLYRSKSPVIPSCILARAAVAAAIQSKVPTF